MESSAAEESPLREAHGCARARCTRLLSSCHWRTWR